MLKKFQTISILLLCLLLIPNVQAAISASYSQAGADTGTVMKGKIFTVTASDWSGSCNSAYLDFSQCPVCSVTEESQTKSITGQSSVTWTTVTTTDTASAQKITVTVSGGCSGESGDSSSFDVVLPPVIMINSYSPTSYSDPTDPSTINLNFRNSGETVAKDVGITLSIPSGVSLTSGSMSQTESTIDPDGNWGTSWTVSFGSVSDSNIYIYMTPSNADSRTITIPIDVADGVPGGDDDDDGGGYIPPAGEEVENKSKKFALVPGVGLRNNTKLQTALEKVMAKGKLSDQALENLMRLSASITSDIEVNKYMESSSTRSNITLSIKYKGEKKVNNFMLHEKIPKAFAQSASEITINAPGATYEVAEQDPEYVFFYPGVDKDQTLTIIYSVDKEVDTSVLDQTETVVYGEGYEGLEEGMICSSEERRCVGDELQECSGDGKSWNTIQTCQYGCENKECNLPPFPEIDWSVFMTAGLAVAVIIIVIVLAIFGLKKRKKSKLSLPKSVPEMKMRPNF